jgi:hypothetical protein
MKPGIGWNAGKLAALAVGAGCWLLLAWVIVQVV